MESFTEAELHDQVGIQQQAELNQQVAYAQAGLSSEAMAATYAAMMQPNMSGNGGGMGQGLGQGAYDLSSMQRPGDFGRGAGGPGSLPMGFNFLDPSGGAAAMNGFATMDSLMAGSQHGAQPKQRANGQPGAPSGVPGSSQTPGQPSDMANVASMLAMAAAASRPNVSSPALTQSQLDHEHLLASLFAQPAGGGAASAAGAFSMPGPFSQQVDVSALAALTAAAYGGPQPSGLSAGPLGPDGLPTDPTGASVGALSSIPGLAMSMGFRPMAGLPQGIGADAAAQFATAALQQQQGSAAAAAAMYAAIMAGNPIDQYGAGMVPAMSLPRPAQPAGTGRSGRQAGVGRPRREGPIQCRVEGCPAVLVMGQGAANALRYRICVPHLRATEVLWEGKASRWCQKCCRMHTLDAFEGMAHTCRAQALRNSERRRRQQPNRQQQQQQAQVLDPQAAQQAAQQGGGDPSAAAQQAALTGLADQQQQQLQQQQQQLQLQQQLQSMGALMDPSGLGALGMNVNDPNALAALAGLSPSMMAGLGINLPQMQGQQPLGGDAAQGQLGPGGGLVQPGVDLVPVHHLSVDGSGQPLGPMGGCGGLQEVQASDAACGDLGVGIDVMPGGGMLGGAMMGGDGGQDAAQQLQQLQQLQQFQQQQQEQHQHQQQMMYVSDPLAMQQQAMQQILHQQQEDGGDQPPLQLPPLQEPHQEQDAQGQGVGGEDGLDGDGGDGLTPLPVDIGGGVEEDGDQQ